MIIIDATDLIAGRICTYAAKKALLGNQVHIINAEKAVLTGKEKTILARFKQKKDMGAPLIGPHFPKRADRIMKRMVRGMIPYKKPRGKEALSNVRCYIGVPSEFEGKKYEDLSHLSVHKTNARYITLHRVSKHLGAKE